MSKSKKEIWWQKSWNPIVGCQKVSPGCANCYAEKMAKRLKAMGQAKYQSVMDDNGWTGKVASKLSLEDAIIALPKKPSVVFVCSMSDLYFKGVADAKIQKVYENMRMFPQHTFIVCTKRPERIIPVLYDSGHLQKGEFLKNVWHLTSVEDQEWADKRIPELIRLKEWGDWKLGLSIEPLLGPIDLGLSKYTCLTEYCDNIGHCSDPHTVCPDNPHRACIQQIIIGSESGPNRRECKIEWVRDIVQQCKAAGVPVFVKQIQLENGKLSKDPAEWPDDLRAARKLAWEK